MGNLRAAALACGVVASVMGGGFGVAYLTSSTVSTADLVTEENADDPVVPSFAASTAANTVFAADNEKSTTYIRTTTKKSYTAENTTAASIFSTYKQEGTTSVYSTEAATAASQISRSVPAPAHAPAAFTQPSTQATTAAKIVAKVTSSMPVAKATSTATQPAATTTTTIATTTTTTTIVATTTAVETTEAAPETTIAYVEVEEEPVVTDVEVVSESGSLPITDEEYIILCNAVAHEAGCNWISTTDKAYVVEVIMNRVNSPRFPNTIYGVLTQPYQFSGAYGYVNLGTYSSTVTQSVKDAVTLYFTEPESFTQGYVGFWGDGYSNHFYK